MDTEKLMNSIPELPEDFETWVRNGPLGYSKYMFTFRENGKRKGYCTHCEQIVSLELTDYRTFTDEDIDNLWCKHNKKGYCPKCRSTVIFKDSFRSKVKIYDFSKAILLQRIGNVACFRFFDLTRNYEHCNCSPVKTQITEEYRLFLDVSEHKSEMFRRHVSYASEWARRYSNAFEIGEVYDIGEWVKMSRVNTNISVYQLGLAHFYNLKELNTLFYDTDFRYCDINAYISRSDSYYKNYIKYITTFCKYQNATEYLMKTGFKSLFFDYLEYPTHHIFNMRAKSPEKLFKLSKSHIKYFKNCSKATSCSNLSYLQQLEKAGYKENTLKFLYEKCESYSFDTSWKIIIKYMTLEKAVNYLKKQKNVTQRPERWYADYINECIFLKYDIKENAVLFPRDLFDAHNRTHELIEAKAQADRERREKETAKRNAKANATIDKNIEKRFEELNKKYEFHSSGLFIRPAKNLSEIKNEGKTQNICVGSDFQSYTKNHAAGVAFILFVRKESEPDKPFYTIEITNNNYIAQCRGFKNCGQTEEVQAFMIEFKKWLNQSARKSA